jgi:hypothetical protein
MVRKGLAESSALYNDWIVNNLITSVLKLPLGTVFLMSILIINFCVK